MRLIQIRDFFGRAEAHKLAQHLVVFFHVRAGIQFAVRKRSRAAFAERHVTFRIQFARFMKIFQRFFALFHRFAALDEKRRYAAF